MMEQTLNFLFEELTQALPDKEDIYLKLKTSADVLREQRLKALSEKDFNALADRGMIMQISLTVDVLKI